MNKFEDLIKLRNAEIENQKREKEKRKSENDADKNPFFIGLLISIVLFILSFHFGFNKADGGLFTGLILQPLAILSGIGILVCAFNYIKLSSKKIE